MASARPFAQEVFRVACRERRCMTASLHVNPDNLPAVNLYRCASVRVCVPGPDPPFLDMPRVPGPDPLTGSDLLSEQGSPSHDAWLLDPDSARFMLG